MHARFAPDRWLVLEVPKPDSEDLSGLIVEVLLAYSGRGVEERRGSLLAYLAEPSVSAEEVVREVVQELTAALGATPPPVSSRWQAHEAWEENWKQGFAPRRITARMVVSPTWERPDLEPGDVLITLDPGMAFGTSQHPTTRGALRLLEPRVAPGSRMADIGAGSGILAIAAGLLGASHVLAIESDPWSCIAARENAVLNRVEDRIEVEERQMGPSFRPGEGPFDGIAANIETQVLQTLLQGFRAGLRPGGWLILSGVLLHEADAMVKAAAVQGFDLEQVEREGDWWSAAFRATDDR